ncbi:2Fe-2S iron-sulfur cluster binding domain-containing protein [Sinimarinibacterium sp. CAU 1509]|uniref:2Fe-2S iron-sulfur cluster-binding protein n=1 Tax=Sinimarinibacterium sp. CAU 1509 TaxID=2562283 RepID=UPI0010AB9D21|nr:2Fe-2S iron-sulfur cluster-binding protein [Sinimarinibacterium sp. CAU 1509]TJY64701.1 2Fe-2S iron-sulfur cluster binding domain-containing protein [Sinimarinibacterium sp. CAU 1509]
MAEVRVKGRDGTELTLDAPDGRPLMDILRDSGTGVEGTCGGMCSCGTCHVYVDAAWVDRLPPKSEDEDMMLEALGEVVELRPNSRLSCQIEISDELAGLSVEIGPAA